MPQAEAGANLYYLVAPAPALALCGVFHASSVPLQEAWAAWGLFSVGTLKIHPGTFRWEFSGGDRARGSSRHRERRGQTL